MKGTNKEDYIVVEPKGILNANQSTLVYFYLKKTSSLNKNLKDRFLLQIDEDYGNGIKKTVFARKFGIMM